MLLILDEISAAGLSFAQDLDLRDLLDDDGRPLLSGPVRLEGKVDAGGLGVELRARMQARLRLHCSRCLESFEQPVEAPVELTLVREAVETGEHEIEMAREDAAVFHAEGGKADLAEITREQIHLLLPLKPVCEPSCRGLCPACGANRNRIECGCREADLDPRLVPLLRLKQPKGPRGGPSVG